MVDVVGGLMTLAAGTLFFFFAVAILDHWIVPGGLAGWSRMLLLVVYLAAAGYFAVRYVVPLLFKRINPVYAAHQIEQAKPTKNSLINFLLFRTSQAPMHRAVYRAVEHQAAGSLAHVRVESAIDRSKLIKIGYVLLGAVVLCGLYKALSPKDPFPSLTRLALPWSDIRPPTRVTLEDITPGDKTVYRGAGVSISAALSGLGDDDVVELIYTTDDRQTVDQVIEMRLERNRYVVDFSAASGGVQQSFTYRVSAGDAHSKPYQIEVIAAPAIEIDRIEYEYPQYTQLENRFETNIRDVQAIEGTKVTIRATANRPIKHAKIEFELEGQEPLAMKVDGTSATRSFRLKYRGKDGVTPDRGRFRLRFTTVDGQDNPDPIDHHLIVKPDLAPEVEFVYPQEREVQVPLDGELSIEVTAVDRDFGLSRVRLQITHLDKTIVDVLLLEKIRDDRFIGRHRFVPRELGLQAEDVLLYRAVASDTKRPQANVTETVWNRIVIVAPDEPDQLAANDRQDDPQGDQDDPQKQPQQADPKQDDAKQSDDKQDRSKQENKQPGDDKHQGDNGSKQDDKQPGDPNGSKQDTEQSNDGGQTDPNGQDGQDGQANPVASDGTEDGEAFERLKQHFDEQDGNQPSGNKPSENKDGKADPKAGEDQTGDAQPGQQAAASDGGLSTNTEPDGAEQDPNAEQKQQPAAKDAESPDQAPSPSQEDGQKKPDGTPDSPKKQDGPDKQDRNDPGAGDETSKPMGDAQPGAGDGQTVTKPDDIDNPPGTEPDSDQKPDEQESDTPGTEKKTDPGAPGEDGQDRQGSGGQKKEDAAGGDADTEQPGTKNSPDKQGGKTGSDDAESTSPAASDKPNDSPGDESSDRKGAGTEGGGQKSEQDGQGSAGSNTPADDGGGKADQPGKGETGEQAGDGQKSPGKTGEPADNGSAGGGSTTEKQPAGSEPGEDSGQRKGDPQGSSGQDHDPADPNENSQKTPSGEKPTDTAGDSASDSVGGGRPPEDDRDRPRTPSVDPAVDKENLEYTRKVTDMVLRRLREELDQDADLSSVFRNRADAEKFYRRYDELRQKARQPGAAGRAARQDLDDGLRSLGLRPARKKIGSAQRSDGQRGLSSSRDTRAPAEFAEQEKAYLQGRARKK